MTNTATFTHDAAAMVARNDRLRPLRRLRRLLTRNLRIASALWLGVAFAGLVLAVFPPSVRVV